MRAIACRARMFIRGSFGRAVWQNTIRQRKSSRKAAPDTPRLREKTVLSKAWCWSNPTYLANPYSSQSGAPGAGRPSSGAPTKQNGLGAV